MRLGAAAALMVGWAAGNAEGQAGSSQGGFIFDTSGERPLTMPFRLNVGLLGFGSDQLQSGASLDAAEIESALMVRCRRAADILPRMQRPPGDIAASIVGCVRR